MKAFRLRFGAKPLLIELEGGPRPHGIAADKAQSHRRSTAAADPKERAHQPFQSPAQISRQAQVYHQGGQHKKGKQRGHNDIEAQHEPVLGPGYGLVRRGYQTRRGNQQRQPHQCVPYPFFLQQPEQAITPVRRDYAKREVKLACPNIFCRLQKMRTTGRPF